MRQRLSLPGRGRAFFGDAYIVARDAIKTPIHSLHLRLKFARSLRLAFIVQAFAANELMPSSPSETSKQLLDPVLAHATSLAEPDVQGVVHGGWLLKKRKKMMQGRPSHEISAGLTLLV